jgi:hypothetical protein
MQSDITLITQDEINRAKVRSRHAPGEFQSAIKEAFAILDRFNRITTDTKALGDGIRQAKAVFDRLIKRGKSNRAGQLVSPLLTERLATLIWNLEFLKKDVEDRAGKGLTRSEAYANSQNFEVKSLQAAQARYLQQLDQTGSHARRQELKARLAAVNTRLAQLISDRAEKRGNLASAISTPSSETTNVVNSRSWAQQPGESRADYSERKTKMRRDLNHQNANKGESAKS